MTADPPIDRTGITIRPAMPQDGKALRMLLPQLRDGAEYLVANEDHGGLVVGAAGMTRSCRTQPIIGPGVALEVIQPFRRRGIGRALLAVLEQLAADRFRAGALYAASRVDLAGDQFERWKCLHFEPIETVREHALSIELFEPTLAPLLQRLRSKGRIPAGARIVPLYQANAAAVMHLHLDHMGGNRGELYRKLSGRGVGIFHPRYSRVLLVNGRVKGCMLAHRVDKHTAGVDANIVDAELRGGWANIWLKLEASRHALKLGIKEFVFTSFDRYTDTRSFTDKLKGRTIRATALMVRPLSRDVHHVKT